MSLVISLTGSLFLSPPFKLCRPLYWRVQAAYCEATPFYFVRDLTPNYRTLISPVSAGRWVQIFIAFAIENERLRSVLFNCDHHHLLLRLPFDLVRRGKPRHRSFPSLGLLTLLQKIKYAWQGRKSWGKSGEPLVMQRSLTI